MKKAIVKLGKPYCVGYYSPSMMIDVEIVIPGYAGFTQTIHECEATPENLEALRVSGEAHIINIVENYSARGKEAAVG